MKKIRILVLAMLILARCPSPASADANDCYNAVQDTKYFTDVQVPRQPATTQSPGTFVTPLVYCVPATSRAYYGFDGNVGGWMDGTVNVVNEYDYNLSKSIIFHEMGHWWDYFKLGQGSSWGSANVCCFADVEDYAKTVAYIAQGLVVAPQTPAPNNPPSLARATLLVNNGWVPPVTTPTIRRLYLATFLRNADTAGMIFWTGQLYRGQSLVDIANFFVTSDEYIARYGRQNSEDYVRQVYVNVLGRQPDSPGLRWWTYMITNDLMTRGRMMVGFSESAEFQAKYPR